MAELDQFKLLRGDVEYCGGSEGWLHIRKTILNLGLDAAVKDPGLQPSIVTAMRQLYPYDRVLMGKIESIRSIKLPKKGIDILNNLLNRYRLPDDQRAYLLTGKRGRDYSGDRKLFFYWEEILEELLDYGISLNDDVIKMICRVLSDSYDGVKTFLRFMYGKLLETTEGFTHLLQLFAGAKGDLVNVSFVLLREYHNHREILMPLIKETLFPDYEEQLLELAATVAPQDEPVDATNQVQQTLFALKLLITYRYTTYRDLILQYVGCLDYTPEIYVMLPDEEQIRERILRDLLYFIHDTIEGEVLKELVIPVVEAYFLTGVEGSCFDELMNQYRQVLRNGVSFYHIFLARWPEDNSIHHQRLHHLAERIDPVNTTRGKNFSAKI